MIFLKKGKKLELIREKPFRLERKHESKNRLCEFCRESKIV